MMVPVREHDPVYTAKYPLPRKPHSLSDRKAGLLINNKRVRVIYILWAGIAQSV